MAVESSRAPRFLLMGAVDVNELFQLGALLVSQLLHTLIRQREIEPKALVFVFQSVTNSQVAM